MNEPNPTRTVIRRFALIGVAGLFGLGLLADGLLAVTAVSVSQNPGDGLGLFFPMILAMIFAPLQLLAVVALGGAWVRTRTLDLVGTPPFERVGAGIAALSAGGMGFPALVMAGVLVARLFIGYDHPLHEWVWWLAEPMTLVWGGLWALGAIGAGLSFGLFDRALPLAAALWWPVLGFAYMTGML